jgi:hypothetical protein
MTIFGIWLQVQGMLAATHGQDSQAAGLVGWG